MILLEKVHPSIQAAVDRILSGSNEIPHTIVRDFDGCSYHICVNLVEPTKNGVTLEEAEGKDGGDVCDDLHSEGRRASVTISLRHSTSFNELNAHHNFEEFLPMLFPLDVREFLRTDAPLRSDHGFVAEVHVPATVVAKRRVAAIRMAGQLRILSYIPLFARQCEMYIAQPGAVLPPLLLRYHDGEEMVVFSNRGSFIVSIALRAASSEELVFMRHFLQAMVDVRKLQREVGGAPAFVYDHGKPPESIPNDLPLLCGADKNIFWCSFQLFRRHMEPVERLVETVTQLVNFRSTLAYHIHAGRAYMHRMMRKRLETCLQVLNRAKTKTTGKPRITFH